MELRRNFALMRELGGRSQEEMREIDKLSDDFLSKIDIYHGSKKKEKMNNIQRKFNKAKEYADDKVQLSVQTYELVCCFLVVHVIFELFYYNVSFRWMNIFGS